jgi:hypothetical protein
MAGNDRKNSAGAFIRQQTKTGLLMISLPIMAVTLSSKMKKGR